MTDDFYTWQPDTLKQKRCMMLRLNKLTDYAVVLLSQLACDHNAVAGMNVTTLARRSSLTDSTIAKVMKSLCKAQLVVSQRGAMGGYRLAKPADSISVAEIIEAMDGPIALTECVEDSGDMCGTSLHCPLRGNWNRVNTAVKSALGAISLADMMGSSIERLSAQEPMMPSFPQHAMLRNTYTHEMLES